MDAAKGFSVHGVPVDPEKMIEPGAFIPGDGIRNRLVRVWGRRIGDAAAPGNRLRPRGRLSLAAAVGEAEGVDVGGGDLLGVLVGRHDVVRVGAVAPDAEGVAQLVGGDPAG